MSAEGLLDKRLDTTGRVTVRKDEIGIEGFEAEGCGCREVAALAILWAIGELQRDLTDLLAQPGGGRSVIEDWEASIFVNSDAHVVTSPVLSYADVLALAGYSPDRVITVLYRGRTGKGTIVPGGAVAVDDGMWITALDTGAA